MRQSKYSEPQILAILRQAEGGVLQSRCKVPRRPLRETDLAISAGPERCVSVAAASLERFRQLADPTLTGLAAARASVLLAMNAAPETPIRIFRRRSPCCRWCRRTAIAAPFFLT
jgi:hypothetical protein